MEGVYSVQTPSGMQEMLTISEQGLYFFLGRSDKPAVTSLQVAAAFGKEHKHVLRDIREVMGKCSSQFTEPNFGPSEYTDSTGRKLPMYVLSKDGLMMVTMGYVSPEAMQIKEAYIRRFNEMEAALHARNDKPAAPPRHKGCSHHARMEPRPAFPQ